MLEEDLVAALDSKAELGEGSLIAPGPEVFDDLGDVLRSEAMPELDDDEEFDDVCELVETDFVSGRQNARFPSMYAGPQASRFSFCRARWVRSVATVAWTSATALPRPDFGAPKTAALPMVTRDRRISQRPRSSASVDAELDNLTGRRTPASPGMRRC